MKVWNGYVFGEVPVGMFQVHIIYDGLEMTNISDLVPRVLKLSHTIPYEFINYY